MKTELEKVFKQQHEDHAKNQKKKKNYWWGGKNGRLALVYDTLMQASHFLASPINTPPPPQIFEKIMKKKEKKCGKKSGEIERKSEEKLE